MTGSDHFAAEHWADFVRHLASGEQATLMERHLADGCPICTKTHADWQAIRDVASTDASYEVPDGPVRLAKAMFSIQKTPNRVARAMDAVKVLFDSQLLPAAEGVRSAWSARGRKVLYATGNFLVDLQIETSRESQRTLVIGQVVCAKEAVENVHGVPVVLLRDLEVIGKGITNRFGEFHMEFEGPSANLSVALGLKEEGTAVSLGSSSVGHS